MATKSEVIDLNCKGLHSSEIAARLHCTSAYVRATLARNGLIDNYHVHPIMKAERVVARLEGQLERARKRLKFLKESGRDST